ncbi:phosphohistidine phosphatase [Escherichia coli]|uniref:Phosphohistidine phosphatase n=1 Tax=Escherichia coli TaxID=562 RepID=A0A377DFU9_ECOLX|nr:phosphohistidine phosphatase [Escherichia coli]
MEIERVLVSPFLRAEQTLEEVGDCLNLPSSAEVLPELTPAAMLVWSVPIYRR